MHVVMPMSRRCGSLGEYRRCNARQCDCSNQSKFRLVDHHFLLVVTRCCALAGIYRNISTTHKLKFVHDLRSDTGFFISVFTERYCISTGRLTCPQSCGDCRSEMPAIPRTDFCAPAPLPSRNLAEKINNPTFKTWMPATSAGMASRDFRGVGKC